MGARKGQPAKYSDADLKRGADAFLAEGSVSGAARRLGIHRSTVQHLLDLAADAGLTKPRTEANPSRWRPGAEIVAARKAEYQRVGAAGANRAGNVIHRPDNGPFCVVALGDEHLDNPGTDLALWERWIAVLDRAKHITGWSLGDVLDNWVKPLAHLYSTAETPAPEGWILLEHYMDQIGQDMDCSVGGNHDCHDMETEALTRRGWIAGAEIRDDDQVLSLDGAGAPVWTPITERIERDNTEEMVSIETSVISLNVTPNHRILHRKRYGVGKKFWSGHRYVRADDLPARFSLPVSAPSGLPEHPLPDSWIELTGWFLTDGGVSFTRSSPKVTFYQSKPSPALEAALEACGFSPRVTTRNRTVTEICGRALKAEPLPSREYVLSADESRRLLAVAQAKRVMPTWVEHLSDRQFRVFLEAIIAGDGAWASGGGDAAVVHGRHDFLSNLQAACVAHGWGAHLSVAREKDWRLNVCTRTEWQAERAVVVHRTPASPHVWCLRVPHGNFMVRRRGKAHFSGNSWSGHSDVLGMVMEKHGVMHRANSLRVAYRCPSGREIYVNARHSWPGRSMWNAAHGIKRAARMGIRDNILLGGHTHISGEGKEIDPLSGKISHCFQVASFKIEDDYADTLGLHNGHLSPAVALVIDPRRADADAEMVKAFYEPEPAADYLKFLRRKA